LVKGRARSSARTADTFLPWESLVLRSTEAAVLEHSFSRMAGTTKGSQIFCSVVVRIAVDVVDLEGGYGFPPEQVFLAQRVLAELRRPNPMAPAGGVVEQPLSRLALVSFPLKLWVLLAPTGLGELAAPCL
jgi:hypothetical protein